MYKVTNWSLTVYFMMYTSSAVTKQLLLNGSDYDVSRFIRDITRHPNTSTASHSPRPVGNVPPSHSPRPVGKIPPSSSPRPVGKVPPSSSPRPVGKVPPWRLSPLAPHRKLKRFIQYVVTLYNWNCRVALCCRRDLVQKTWWNKYLLVTKKLKKMRYGNRSSPTEI